MKNERKKNMLVQAHLPHNKTAPGKKTGTKRNNVLQKVSPLTSQDKELFQKTILKFRPLTNHYEDSWGYIIQATRYDGFKWYDKRTGSLVLFGKKSRRDDTLVVPNFIGKISYLKDVLNKVLEQENISKAIIKNVNPLDKLLFLAQGFREYNDDEYWSKYAPYDDQTFPQLVIDLNRLAVPKGRQYRNLRTALRKPLALDFRKYKSSDKEEVLILFSLRDGNNSKNISQEARENGMYYVSHAMYPDASLDKMVFIDRKTNKIIGFIASSDISKRNTCLVASIFKPTVNTESVWGIYQSMLLKYQQGFQQINIGGVETSGTFHFLRRYFRPVEQIAKTHLVYLRQS